jgi:hypothetical protein
MWLWRATQGWPTNELLKKGDFILHLPFWNVQLPMGGEQLQNIKESEAVYCF